MWEGLKLHLGRDYSDTSCPCLFDTETKQTYMFHITNQVSGSWNAQCPTYRVFFRIGMLYVAYIGYLSKKKYYDVKLSMM